MCVCVRACVRAYTHVCLCMSYFKNDNNSMKKILANHNTLPNESLFKTRGNEEKKNSDVVDNAVIRDSR